MKFVFRMTALVFALLFAAMAWLQLDDPDSLIWIAAYGSAACAALAVVIGAPVRWLLVLFAVSYTVWAIVLSPNLGEWLSSHEAAYIMDDESKQFQYMERSRECLGLAIVVVGLLWLLMVDALTINQSAHR